MLQTWALIEALNEEQEARAQRDENQMRYTLAATNPQLYKTVFGQQSVEEEGVVWTTPQTPEEVDELLTLIGEQHVGSES